MELEREMLGRTAHDLGLAALLGGNLFGRLAMHPALEAISDKSERGTVLNRAWRRYGTINSLALLALVAGWASERFGGPEPRAISPRERGLRGARDAAVGAVAVTGLAAATEGIRFAASAPGGAVPLASGSEPAPETPPKAARLKRILSVLGGASAVSEIALVGLNAALARESAGRLRPRRLAGRR